MSYTENFTEMHCPLDELHPADQKAGSYNSAYVSLANYHRAIVLLALGTVPQGGTVDLALYQATDTTGTGRKAITGHAITQLTAADDDVLVAIELQTEELDVTGGFDCFRAEVTVGAQTVPLYLAIFGIEPRFAPVSTAGYAEIVN